MQVFRLLKYLPFDEQEILRYPMYHVYGSLQYEPNSSNVDNRTLREYRHGSVVSLPNDLEVYLAFFKG